MGPWHSEYDEEHERGTPHCREPNLPFRIFGVGSVGEEVGWDRRRGAVVD